MKIFIFILCLYSFFVTGCANNSSQPQATENKSNEANRIVQAVDKAANWQLAHMKNFESYVPSLVKRTKEPRGWVQGTFFLGLSSWAKATDNAQYFDYLRQHGQGQQWKLGERRYHGDDHVIAQYYLDMYERDKSEEVLQPLLSEFNEILSAPPSSSLDFSPRGKISAEGYDHDCQKRWCWSDALFMSPPVWFSLSNITGDEKYANYADKEYRAVTEYLFDKESGLFFRDSRFFERREKNGAKIFWSRGNGWVFSGLTNIIESLDSDDPRRDWYIKLFQRMAKSLAVLQADNGYWPVSLNAGDLYKVPESSGTAFFVAGLAWGVNNNVLSADDYFPVINKGWQALLAAQKQDGMLGWVQQIGYAPDKVSPDQTQLYGAGAFLLAGTQMLELSKSQH